MAKQVQWDTQVWQRLHFPGSDVERQGDGRTDRTSRNAAQSRISTDTQRSQVLIDPLPLRGNGISDIALLVELVSNSNR